MPDPIQTQPTPVSAPRAPPAAPPKAPAPAAPTPAGGADPKADPAMATRLSNLARVEAQKLRLEQQVREYETKLKGTEGRVSKDDLAKEAKANPLKFMQDYGLNYAEVTKLIVEGKDAPPDPRDTKISALEKEIQAIKEGTEQLKTQTVTKQQQEEAAAVKSAIAETIKAGGDDYQLLAAYHAPSELVWSIIEADWNSPAKAGIPADERQTLTFQDACALAEQHMGKMMDTYLTLPKVRALYDEKLKSGQPGAPAKSAPKGPVTAASKAASKSPGINNKMTPGGGSSSPGQETWEEKKKRVAREAAAMASA